MKYNIDDKYNIGGFLWTIKEIKTPDVIILYCDQDGLGTEPATMTINDKMLISGIEDFGWIPQKKEKLDPRIAGYLIGMISNQLLAKTFQKLEKDPRLKEIFEAWCDFDEPDEPDEPDEDQWCGLNDVVKAHVENDGEKCPFSDDSELEDRIEKEINDYQTRQRAAWEKEYGDDPIVTWDEFREKYRWCDQCNSWQEGYCVCYSR